jgi:hypothetical protein
MGAIVAIPVMAAFRVFVEEVAAPAIRRQTGASQFSGERAGQDDED